MTDQEKQNDDRRNLRLNNFAFVLGECRGHIGSILEDSELSAEFIVRGVSESDLKALKEAINKVAAAYYNSIKR